MSCFGLKQTSFFSKRQDLKLWSSSSFWCCQESWAPLESSKCCYLVLSTYFWTNEQDPNKVNSLLTFSNFQEYLLGITGCTGGWICFKFSSLHKDSAELRKFFSFHKSKSFCLHGSCWMFGTLVLPHLISSTSVSLQFVSLCGLEKFNIVVIRHFQEQNHLLTGCTGGGQGASSFQVCKGILLSLENSFLFAKTSLFCLHESHWMFGTLLLLQLSSSTSLTLQFVFLVWVGKSSISWWFANFMNTTICAQVVTGGSNCRKLSSLKNDICWISKTLFSPQRLSGLMQKWQEVFWSTCKSGKC